jgi:hypothetical protein
MTQGYAKDNGGNRYTHLVGGVPADSARAAIAQMLDHLGPTLLQVPDGENPTADIPARANWIEPEILAVPSLPGVITRNAEARYTSYEDTPWYEATGPLTADDFDPVVVLRRAFEASYPVFRELRDERGLGRLRFQAGVPSVLDLALIAFREAGLAADLFNLITEAKARQVLACHAHAPGDVVFQLETPVAVRWVATAADPATAAVDVAGLLTDLPRLCPGTAWGVHLCDGDWHHQAAVEPSSALPLVLLASQIIAQWPAGPGAPVLGYIHMPFAAASKPPAADPAWYAPLGDLHKRMPEGCRLAAGFVHERVGLTELRSLLRVIEDAYGAPVTIAATCGLGRRPEPGQAVDAITKMAALAAA